MDSIANIVKNDEKEFHDHHKTLEKDTHKLCMFPG